MLRLSPQAALLQEWSLKSEEWREGCEFVGNGLDRSGIVAVITILNKIRIENNIQQSEPEQASRFPTISFQVTHPHSKL